MKCLQWNMVLKYVVSYLKFKELFQYCLHYVKYCTILFDIQPALSWKLGKNCDQILSLRVRYLHECVASWLRSTWLRTPGTHVTWVQKFEYSEQDKISWQTFLYYCTSLQRRHWSVDFVVKDTIHFIQRFDDYRQISNISHTISQNLNVSHLILQLAFHNILKPGVKSRMKM